MSDASREQDIAELTEELASTLRELRGEVAIDRPPRGPFGLPRPPTPREMLRFTDEAAIPAAIAVLEANIRALELLQRALRLTDTEREARERGRRVQARAENLSRATLERLDDALADLQSALEGEPPDPEARSLLDEARELRREIDDRLGDTSGDAKPDEVEIDIDAELESIKEDVREEDPRDPDG